MRVIRDQQTGRVLVEVAGKQYASIREISDAQVGRRVLWAISDLVRFTGGMATNPQAMRSVAKEEPARQPEPEPVAAPTAPQAAPVSVSALARPAASEQPQAQPTPPPRPVRATSAPLAPETPRERYSLLGYFRQGFTRESKLEPVVSTSSFIDEIEAILQARIQQLAAPLPSDVHVLAGGDGALQIEVGLDVYGSPDEVPDPQIRQLIKDAVAEWEKS